MWVGGQTRHVWLYGVVLQDDTSQTTPTTTGGEEGGHGQSVGLTRSCKNSKAP